MQKRQLGKSDLSVSPIGLGCWQFSQGKGLAGKYWRALDQNDVNEIVAESLRMGINWFDTAEAYGNGASEQALARALKENRINLQEIYIATKWQPVLRFAGSISRTFGKRIKNLSPYQICLYQVHNAWSLSSIQSQMRAMADLVKNGKLCYIGVSNFSAERMRRSNNALVDEGLSLASNQMRFNLLDRSIEKNGVLDAAKELGISIIAYSPLAQGILSGKYHQEPGLIKRQSGFRKYMKHFSPKELKRTKPLIDELRRISRNHNATPAQISLAWVVQVRGNIIVAIPGASSVKQAHANAAAMDIVLSSKEMQILDEVSLEIMKGTY